MEVQAWEDAGLEHFSLGGEKSQTLDQGGASSPGMMAPVTPKSNVPSDEDVDIPTLPLKHPFSIPL